MSSTPTEPLYNGEEMSLSRFLSRTLCVTSQALAQFGIETCLDELPNPETLTLKSTVTGDLKAAWESKLARLESLTPEQAESEATANRQQLLKAAEDSAAEAKLRKARCEQLMAEVLAWQPPTDEHLKLKQAAVLLLQQDEAMEDPIPTEIPAESGEAYKERCIAQAKKEIAYHTKKQLEANRKAEEAREFVRKLKASLPQPEIAQ